MKKRLNITIFFVMFSLLVLSSSFVFSAENDSRPDYDQALAYEWLINELEESNWNVNVRTLSWAILALSNGNRNYDEGIDKLLNLESGNNWNGNVYETALATMALDRAGENIDDEVAWLLDQQDPVSSGGKWLIQFNPTSSSSSNCIITYEGEEFSFTVNQTDIIPADNCSLIDDAWVDFEVCIKGGGVDLYESFRVECLSGFSSSLLFRTGSGSYEYYILDENSPLEIENGRFSDCGNSQYGAWALDELGNRSYVIPYLKQNCNEGVIDNAFLYLLTSENRYSDNLENTQSAEGSWGPGNIYETSIALISLKKGSAFSSAVTDAEDWLEWKQDRTTGSWNENPEWTAFVLYALTDGSGYSTPSTGFCGNDILEYGEDCENNSDCFSGEECQNCQCVDVAVNFSCTIADPGANCDENNPCSSDQRCNPTSCICEDITSVECTSDYDCYSGEVCTNGQCVSSGTSYTDCTYDSDCDSGEICVSGTCIEEEKSNWVTWLIVILVVILGLVGGYFAYMKFFKGKGGTKFGAKPGSKPPGAVSPFKKTNYPKTRQRVPFAAVRRPARTNRADTKTESDLDTALAKAKKIIGK